MARSWDASEVLRRLIAEAKVTHARLAEEAKYSGGSVITEYANGKPVGEQVAARIGGALERLGVKNATSQLMPPPDAAPPSRVERRLAALSARVEAIEKERAELGPRLIDQMTDIQSIVRDLAARVHSLEEGRGAGPARTAR